MRRLAFIIPLAILLGAILGAAAVGYAITDEVRFAPACEP